MVAARRFRGLTAGAFDRAIAGLAAAVAVLAFAAMVASGASLAELPVCKHGHR